MYHNSNSFKEFNIIMIYKQSSHPVIKKRLEIYDAIKPKIKIDETIDMTWDDLAPHLSLIYHNIYMFKKINNIKQ